MLFPNAGSAPLPYGLDYAENSEQNSTEWLRSTICFREKRSRSNRASKQITEGEMGTNITLAISILPLES
jgi:hypothetical protein